MCLRPECLLSVTTANTNHAFPRCLLPQCLPCECKRSTIAAVTSELLGRDRKCRVTGSKTALLQSGFESVSKWTFQEKLKLTTYINIFEKQIFALDIVVKHADKSLFSPFVNEIDCRTQYKVIIKNALKLLCHIRMALCYTRVL